MTENDDVIRRVYVQVLQLAENPPELVDINDVERYHKLLDRLDSVGFDSAEFRFDIARDMYYPSVGWNGDWQPIYGSIAEMRPDIFTRQVRALATYFEIREKPVIFSGPRHQVPINDD